MSWPTKSKCFKEIVEDSSKLWLLPKEEWTSIRELPLMGALQFRVILERLFTYLTSPAIWGKTWVESITNNGQKISGEAIPMVIWVTDGMGEEKLGMVPTFFHHNQGKVEDSEVLPALHQCDLLEPSVVVVQRFTNSPYLPWASFGLLYLDIPTPSRDALHLQNFHWTQLHSMQATSLIQPLRWSWSQEGGRRKG